ncbi:FlxA-like family protein [Paenibacillus humicus]|uniref:FlxA-like family protein n=1 Tax=Paenibacillus humicus TaxID=412861 RepID=UPI000FDB0023|nr:FlxA-like family protein [Paenibacillus humicus]
MSSISAVPKTDRGSNKITSSPAQDKEIQQLNKQRAKIQEELASVSSNKEMDSKLKMERVKSLTSGMQQIDSRISEIRMENLKRSAPETRSPEPASPPAKTAHDPHLAVIIEKSSSLTELNKSVGLRAKMGGEIKTLEGGVRSDRTMLEAGPSDDGGRSAMLQNAEETVYKMKREMVQEIHSQIHVVDKKMDELISEINDISNSSEDNMNSNGAVLPEDEDENGSPSKSKELQAADVGSAGSLRPAAASIDIRV